jgi:diaminohydroxyphosphoribosylaminopyrimidine deaminase / 5-amino-6-(5-phosphoribosylamino)uracil reductase
VPTSWDDVVESVVLESCVWGPHSLHTAEATGSKPVTPTSTNSLLDLALSERQVKAILLEGGPTLAGSFLAAGLIGQVVAYIAPVLIGGGGKPALAGPGAPNIADAKRFQLEDVVRIGPDVRLTATPLS